MSLQKFFGPSRNATGGRGIKTIVYMDDGIPAWRSFEIAKSVSELVSHNLLSAGFAINNEKSDFNPKTKRKWLDRVIDTKKLTFTVSQEKIAKLLEEITPYLNQEFLTPN